MMGLLYVTEYAAMASTTRGAMPIPDEPALRTQVVPFGQQSNSSEPFSGSTRFVRLHANEPCAVKFGAGDIEATGEDMRLGAEATEYFGVQPGLRVAVTFND